MTFYSLLPLRTVSLVACTALTLAGCSSSSNDTPAPPPATDDSGTDANVGSATGCPTSVIGIAFKPMYSAFDGTHKFQIPATVVGLDPAAITWTASDPNLVDLAPNTTTGIVIITTRGAGSVSIIAHAGNLCGSSLLTITQSTPDEWDIGNERYNNGVVLNPARGGGVRLSDGSADAKCTNCHGDLAAGPYKTVAHTPQQTGGFSDAELLQIFRHGNVPDGGYFDTTIVSYADWQRFHQWDMTDDEAKGIIVYLRALTPQEQTGVPNFGNQGGPRDGGNNGRPEAGQFGRPEGGGGNGNGNRNDAAPGAADATPEAEAAPPAVVDAGVTPSEDASLTD